MRRSFADARRWMQRGTAMLVKEADVNGGALSASSALPGWSRKHLLAHVAGNADALGNLIHWAATGIQTPMYASANERAAGIEIGSQLPAGDLISWLHRSADRLEEAMNLLSAEHWQASVLTAQGRTVPASEVPWMRAREVWVHAIDLGTGLTFADLPADFASALCDDAAAKRSAAAGPALTLEAAASRDRWEVHGSGEPVMVIAPLPEITAYLTGRPYHLTTAAGDEVPVIPPWL
jgi:uncharacterized protein (TIGR03083 family)